jgi:F420-non-reducing hydrogenase small subunit
MWLGGCGGCDEAIVDLNEDVLKVAGAVEFVLWPVALDFKYHQIEAMQDGEIALSIINGSVRNSELAEFAKTLRKKSQLVLAFGACACFGGTPGLANFRSRDDIFQWVYKDAPTVNNPDNNYPQTVTSVGGRELTLPSLFDDVRTLGQTIDVDYYLPGCPPPVSLIVDAVSAVLEGNLPPKGSTLAPERALCDVCERNKTKPEKLGISAIKRIHEIEADPDKCFLAQGVVCSGPATRAGCGEVCLKINMPCRGCFGPVEGVAEMGSKYLSAFASLIDAPTVDAAKSVADQLVDPTGYFYRFTAASSLLRKKREASKKE